MEAPRGLGSEDLHPQEEEPHAAVAELDPVAAAEPVPVEATGDQAKATHVEGVAGRVEGLERDSLARALEVRQDEGEEERDAP